MPLDIPRLVPSAASFIAKNAGTNAGAVQAVLEKFVALARDDCLAGCRSEDRSDITAACWLEVRMFKDKDSEEYKVLPRWHRDGRMFDCACSTDEASVELARYNHRVPHAKYAITLLGPPTRILRATPEVDDLVNSINFWTDEGRREIAEKMQGREEVRLELGQVIRFSFGQKDSPVHSEPDWSGGDRVFVSLMFGSEKELQCMCKWRELEFGRIYEE